MHRRWTGLAILLALGGAPLAHLTAQQSGSMARVADDLSYERETSQSALDMLEAQLSQIQGVTTTSTTAVS
jgi:hypothetical protein